MPTIRIKTAPTDAEPKRRGSKPGVKRGSYKPRRAKVAEPQTPEELAALEKRARDYWGDFYSEGRKVYAKELGRYVSMRHYIPPDDCEPGRDKLETEVTSKVCRGCGLDWPLSYFSPNGRGGFKARCKDCLADDARDYAHTPEGKTARARAQAKFRAGLKAQERQLKAREDWFETLRKTSAGRAILADFEARQAANGKGAKLIPANFFRGKFETNYLQGPRSEVQT
ncbi:hypothetical protein WKW77_12160 [Variovorax ureilyticus]|uniref:Uncharacterized protein n=1 Tax=Variovorax ureilyticus TaxID=1836198 RepID=A0ABU8VE05_9BURK